MLLGVESWQAEATALVSALLLLLSGLGSGVVLPTLAEFVITVPLVSAVEPIESGVIVIGLPERGLAFVEFVQLFDERLKTEVIRTHIQEFPGDIGAGVPFGGKP